MERLRALIVDDEQLARERIKGLLALEPDVVLAGECASGREARARLEQEAFDLLFLDVQMPEVDGFEVLRGLPAARLPVVVFVTAHDRFALRAFEVRALDYLLKPFDPERFRLTLERARQWLRREGRQALAEQVLEAVRELRPQRPPTERLVVKDGSRLTFVKVEDIHSVEAAGNYVSLQCGEKSHLLRQTMAEMEAQLDPERFVRIHRSTIVNVERIQALEPLAGGDWAVLLEGGRQLTLSRSFRERLHRVLGTGA